MLKYGETTSIKMIIAGKANQVYSASNPVTGLIQINVSDWPLKASGIRISLLRRDMSHFIKKRKDICGSDYPGCMQHNHYEKLTEVCSKMIAKFDDEVI